MFFLNRQKRRDAKRLAQIGSAVDTSYLLYINNNDPITFGTKKDLLSYLTDYRSENLIHKLQIFRVETYSL